MDIGYVVAVGVTGFSWDSQITESAEDNKYVEEVRTQKDLRRTELKNESNMQNSVELKSYPWV